MIVLRWARRMLLVFVVFYAASLAVGMLADDGNIVDAAYLAGIVSIIGLIIASLTAIAAQLLLFVRARGGKRIIHG